MMKSFSELKKNLKKSNTGLATIKVALLGDTATQFLNLALSGTAIDYGFDFKVLETDFNQVENQVFDSASELYAFNPDIVIIFFSSNKLLSKYNRLTIGHDHLAEVALASINDIYASLKKKLNTKIIFYNYPEIDDAVFGNYANKMPGSFLFQLRKLNFELMLLASELTDLHICDLSSIQNQVGKHEFFQPSIYVNTEMVLSIDVLPIIAAKTLDLISSMYGKFKKCIIVDLDNTIWGGIVGDEGIENIQLGNLGIGKAFTDFQYWLKKLKNRGIILTVCSKNTESNAREPFEKHPDMILRLNDIAVFKANWENKVDNIYEIQKILNIGFDSMVFLDDNPFERNIVRQSLPQIVVPELPEDPADFLEFLYKLNLFETISFSGEDKERTRKYQVESQRSVFKKSFDNEEEFLKSLNMCSLLESFSKFTIPRVAQLSQRSNQFNLRTVRYSEGQIEAIANSDKYYTFTFTLEDVFGDNGLVCVVILKKEDSATLFIDTWFMSCRVLKRGMEHFVLNTIVTYALAKGFRKLKGEYISTAKNEMVKDHYKNLGFKKNGNYWILNLNTYEKKHCYIQNKQMVHG